MCAIFSLFPSPLSPSSTYSTHRLPYARNGSLTPSLLDRPTLDSVNFCADCWEDSSTTSVTKSLSSPMLSSLTCSPPTLTYVVLPPSSYYHATKLTFLFLKTASRRSLKAPSLPPQGRCRRFQALLDRLKHRRGFEPEWTRTWVAHDCWKGHFCCCWSDRYS